MEAKATVRKEIIHTRGPTGSSSPSPRCLLGRRCALVKKQSLLCDSCGASHTISSHLPALTSAHTSVPKARVTPNPPISNSSRTWPFVTTRAVQILTDGWWGGRGHRQVNILGQCEHSAALLGILKQLHANNRGWRLIKVCRNQKESCAAAWEMVHETPSCNQTADK